MANRRDDYMNRRSWLIDTAETPADQKRLKSELAKLDKKFNPNRVASTSKAKPATKTTGIKATKKQVEKVRAVANLVAPFASAKKTTAKKAAVKPSVKKKAGKK
jgi:hypothetical protein